MKFVNKNSLLIGVLGFVALFGAILPTSAMAASTPSLGIATTFSILASTYTNTAATILNGDLGYTTPPVVVPTVSGTTYVADATYNQAGIDQGIALTALNAESCDFTFGSPTDLSLLPQPLVPGVYCITGATTIGTAGITLNGSGTYLFKIDGALDTVVNSVVTLNGGASACDLFWTATSATTLAADTTFAGTVIDDAGITVGANSIWTGRALAFGGTVTTDSTTITVPTCAVLPPPPATLRVIKLVVNTSGGTAVPADFNLHVKELGVDVLGSPAVGIGAPGTSYSLTAGTYVVSEDVNSSYTQSFTGDCNLSGSISLLAGDSKVCTIVNTDIAIPVPPSAPSGISGIPGNLLPQPGSGGGGGGRYSARVIPLIGLSKVPSPLVLPVGSGFVNYNYSVWNVGGAQTLTDINLTDDKCSSISLVSGDLNDNNKLDSDENWKYVCGINLTETTTNTAIVTGYSDDSYRDVAVATAIATVVVGQSVTPPLIDIVKVPSRLVPFPFGGGEVIYSYTVTNPGVTPISNVVVSDDKCSPLSLAKGDNNNNRLLDTDEVWSYLCKTNISVSTMNIATAEGVANGFIAIDYAFATVLVSSPGFPNSGFGMKWDTIIMLVLILLVPSTVLLVLRKTKLKRI